MAVAVRTSRAPATTPDPLALHGIDHLELWVGNAFQAAHFYQSLFGFDIIAWAGPETGVRDRASYVLRQGSITLVVTSGLSPDSPIVRHVALHGDGVRDIALRLDDVDAAFEEVTRRGARGVVRPETRESQRGSVRRAAIATYGETLHSFIDRAAFHGTFLPGYRRTTNLHGESTGVKAIDHVVANVELGQMERWVAFYRDILGFSQLVHFSDDQISTAYTALMSKVMQDSTSRVKFPINEPAPGARKSQIQEYLDYYRGPGVQHIALLTGDIIETVSAMQARGLRFLRVPDTYYTICGSASARSGRISKPFGDWASSSTGT